MELKNGDICISIPENFERVPGYYDRIYEAKEDFNRKYSGYSNYNSIY